MRLRRLLCLACLVVAAACRPAPGPLADPAPVDPPAPVETASGPIVLLVAIDGMRWDALNPDVTPNLIALAGRGVRADALIPPFPSLALPSSYTIVTGLRPARHGIVADAMIDPATGTRFAPSGEGGPGPAWWGGEPIWVTAARHGLRSGTLYWPGSRAEIDGIRPTYQLTLDDEELPAEDRVAEALGWMALPADERPSLVAVSFADVEHAGHRYGPDALETREALQYDDAAVGALLSGITSLGLDAVTSVVVVSAHGMTGIGPDRVIYVDDFLDLSLVDVVTWSPVLGVIPKAGHDGAVYDALAEGHPALRVYRREALPEALGYRDHPRIPPIVGLAEEGWTVTTRDPLSAVLAAGPLSRGSHGYDPTRATSMHGVFVAAGPGLRQNVQVPAFDSVHVYELLCRLLGIPPAPNDGDPEVLGDLLVAR